MRSERSLTGRIRGLGQDATGELLDLLERAAAPHSSSLLELKSSQRLLPLGFVPLALAGALSVAAAGVHERLHGQAQREPTHLRDTHIAYAATRGRSR
jgi:hypothetical protein